MTEEEWLGCTDPWPMLEFLRDKASKRKFRLFAVACCRRIAPLFVDHHQRESIEIAERHADGLATDEELEAARVANDCELIAPPGQRAENSIKKAGYFVADEDAFCAAVERRNSAYAVIFRADPEALQWWQEPPSAGDRRYLTSFTEGDLWLTEAGRAAA